MYQEKKVQKKETQIVSRDGKHGLLQQTLQVSVLFLGFFKSRLMPFA
jgi:hypothetical protein